MGNGSIWEVRSLRLMLAISFLIMSYLSVDSFFHRTYQTWLENTLIFVLPTVWGIYAVYLILRLNRTNYAVHLLIVIFTIHLTFNGFLLGKEWANLQLLPEERLGVGRAMDFSFNSFQVLAITALFFQRLWAVFLWIALSLIPTLKIIFFILSHPLTYFTGDWPLLLRDGYAISSWMLQENITLSVFFVALLLGIAFFNRYVLRATLIFEKANAALGRYFSPDIKNEIEDADSVFANQEPKDMRVAVMFTDLISCTKTSESMDPKEVLKLLSEYQTIMVDCIFKSSGTVDKFIGDAVMANFGTPRSHGNDAQNAFDCALMMHRRMNEWNSERQSSGLDPINHRVGIHYGDCVVGNMGSEQRVEFAVIGDTVNVASRICDACKQHDTNFLISGEMAKQIVNPHRSEIVKSETIRGRSEPIDLIKIYPASI